MSQFRFTLEPYVSQKNRYECPSCGKKHTFTRYIDLEENQYVGIHVGKCDREQKCGYHFKPKEYFQSQKTYGIGGASVDMAANAAALKQIDFQAKRKSLPTSFIDKKLFHKSLEETNKNNFLSYLEKVLNPEAVIEVKDKYRIGTSRKWKGATVFWQIDDQKKIRTGKMMLYDKNTGKKKKINWIHSVLKLPDFNLKQCLFGLHLLNSDRTKPIALVESEKTAVIASIAFPEFIWMATGGLLNLKEEMIKPLANRKVILFPDAGCYDDWNKKVKDLPKNIHFMISDLVENKATEEEKRQGLDIADYIIQIYLERAIK